MINSKYINVLTAILVVLVLAGTWAVLVYRGDTETVTAEPEYVSEIFDKKQITQVDIVIKEADFAYLLENAREEEYRSCDITINGHTYKNVGLRPKGNSSLNMIASDDSTDRFSFKVEFDTYIEGQNCLGLDKLVLNNMVSDATYMKEYLSYDLFARMGVVTPAYTFANITVNGEPWGFYLMVEALEEDFVARNYGDLGGNLYKPEGTGADLKFTDDKASSYAGIKEGAAYKVTDDEFERIITMIDNLNRGNELEKYLDVDACLRYFAVNSFLVNFDSYTGNMMHNYYLYEKDGQVTILPWDLNMSFAGFGINNAQEAINYSIDQPVMGNLSDRPLLAKLLEVDAYKARYQAYLKEIAAEYMQSGEFSRSIDELDQLINAQVKNDPTALVTYEQYTNSLPVLKKFGLQRAASVLAQLEGSEEKITTAINLSDLGSMNRGGGGGQPRGQGGGARPEGEPDGNRVPPGGFGDRPRQNDGQMPMNDENGNRRGPAGAGIMRPQDDGEVPNFDGAGAGPNRQAPGARGQANSWLASQMTRQQLIYVGISLGIALLGLLLAARFQRRK